MSEPFLAEVRIVAFNFAPRGWALCDGQLLPISSNSALFSLLGTTYGGDGRTTFALPDLRGRAPMHETSGHALGQRSGAETHTLTSAELPSHDHVMNGSGDNATTGSPAGNVPARATFPAYGAPSSLTALNAAALASTGPSTPHENMQPWLALYFVIALQGLFPSRS